MSRGSLLRGSSHGAQDQARMRQHETLIGGTVRSAEELGSNRTSFLHGDSRIGLLARRRIHRDGAEIDRQWRLARVLEAHAGLVLLALRRKRIARVHSDDGIHRCRHCHVQLGSRWHCSCQLVADEPQMLDHAAARARRSQKAFVCYAILIVAENIAHMRKQLEQDIAEIRLVREVLPFGKLGRHDVVHSLEQAFIVARHVVDDRPTFDLRDLSHG